MPPDEHDLCTLADVRQALEIPAADTGRNGLIEAYITRASDLLADHADREFVPTVAAATRTFRVIPTPDQATLVALAPFDLRVATTVTLNPGSAAAVVLAVGTDYELDPVGERDGVYDAIRLARGVAFDTEAVSRFGHTRLSILGDWGWAEDSAALPPKVVQAAVVTVSAWLRRDVAAFALADEVGNSRANLPTPPTNFAIPGAARRLLRRYRRTVIA